MTKEEYVQKKISAGHSIHFNNGTWWENSKNGYCKPAVLFEEIIPGRTKPQFSKSYIGYNHRIADPSKATGFWHPFILKKEMLDSWEARNLKSKGRKSSIKKGMKTNKILRVKDIVEFKRDLSQLLKSVAIRTQHGHPPEYYNMNNTAWWNTLERVANYTEFWMAFNQEKLAGYICIHVMGNRVVIDGVKVDTAFLNASVIDGTLATIILDLKARGNIDEIWYGGKSDRPTLDKFKTSYGFELIEVPYQIRLLGGAVKYPAMLNKFRSI